MAVLQVTFADTLGAAKQQGDVESEVTSKNEAKKLAFYLFWNIKPSFNRSAYVLLQCPLTVCGAVNVISLYASFLECHLPWFWQPLIVTALDSNCPW